MATKSALSQALSWVGKTASDLYNNKGVQNVAKAVSPSFKAFSDSYNTFKQTQQAASQNQRQSFVNQIKTGEQQKGGNLLSFFNPTSNNGNNFWTTPVARKLVDLRNWQSNVGKELQSGAIGGVAAAKQGGGVLANQAIRFTKEYPITASKPEQDLYLATGGLIKPKNTITLNTMAPGIQLPGERLSKKLIASGNKDLQTKKQLDATLPQIEDRGFFGNVTNPAYMERLLLTTAPQFIASTGLGAAVGYITKNPIAALSVTGGTSLLPNIGDVYQDAISSGADERTAQNVAMGVGTINSVLDSIGVGKILDKFAEKPLRKIVINQVLKDLAFNAVTEGSTESVQQLVQNAAAKAVYDAKRDLMQGVGESFVAGGIMGGAGSGISDVIIPGLHAHEQMTPQERQGGFVRIPGVQDENNPTLPKELSGAKPRYSYGQKNYTLAFQSDIDKALYIVGNTKTLSARDSDYMSFLKESLPHLSEEQIRTAGQQMRNAIKLRAKEGDGGELTISQSGFGAQQTQQAPNAMEGIDQAITPSTNQIVDQAVQDTAPQTGIPSVDGGATSMSNEEMKQTSAQEAIVPDQNTAAPQEKPVQQEEPIKVDPTPEEKLGTAVWKSPNGRDVSVNVTGYSSDFDGREYVSIEGSNDLIPVEQILFPGEKQRGLVTSIKENQDIRQGVREQVAGKYDVNTDEGRMQFGRDYVEHNYESAIQQALSDAPLTNELAAIHFALDEKISKLADAAEKSGDSETAQKLDELNAKLDNAIAEKATGHGQVIQFLHKWSQRSAQSVIRWAKTITEQANEGAALSPGRAVKKALGQDYRIEFTKEKEAMIKEKMKEIHNMPDGTKKSEAMLKLMREVTKDIPPSLMQYTDAYRYENMLSGPRTHLRNAFGNLMNSEVIYPAVLAQKGVNDFLASIVTGKEREYLVSDALRYYRGQLNGLSQGMSEFYKIMTGELTGLDVSAMTGEHNSDQLFNLQALTSENMPVLLSVWKRLLLGSDRFFKNLIFAGERDTQLSKGATEEEANNKAADVAAYYTYTGKNDPFNKSGQGKVLSAIDRATTVVNLASKKVPLFKYFVPFVNISMNIIKMSTEFNPVTGPTTLIGSTHKADQIAKMQLGAYVMLGFAGLAAKGMTAWEPPKDKEGSDAFYASGRKPYSFYNPATKEWIPMAYLGPLAWSAAIPAALHHFQSVDKNALTETQLQQFEHGAMSAVGFFSNQSFLSGVGGLVKTAQGNIDYSVAKNLGYTAGQMIPWNSMLRYVNGIIDPVFRKSSGFVDELKKSIPGATKDMPAYSTPTGEESKRNLSDYIAPWTTGQADEKYNGIYKDSVQKSQESAVNTAFENAVKSGSPTGIQSSGTDKLKEEDVKKRMKLYLETDNADIKAEIAKNLEAGGWSLGDALETTMKEQTQKDTKGMSDESKHLLERSGEFGFIRKLMETYADNPGAAALVSQKMKEKNISPEDMIYDNQTALPDDVQLEEIKSNLSALTGDDLVATLISYRRVSEGTRKPLLTDALVTKLEKEGKISSTVGDYLKTVGWDSKKKTYTTIANATGGKKKKFKLDVSVPKTRSTRLKLSVASSVKPLSSLAGSTKSKAGSGPQIRLPKSAYAQYKPMTKNLNISFRTPVKRLSGLGGTA